MTTPYPMPSTLAHIAASRGRDHRAVAAGVDGDDIRQSAYVRVLQAQPSLFSENELKAYVARAEGSVRHTLLRHDLVRKPLAGGGWFDDPDVPGRERRWTGAHWTTHVRRGTVETTAAVGPVATERLPRTSERPADADLLGVSAVDPADVVARRALVDEVRTAVGTLDARHRRFYQLRFVEQRELAEVATTMGVSGGALRNLQRTFRGAARSALVALSEGDDVG